MDPNHREALKASLASYFGTALEFYDFLVFGFVATTIAPLFFPSGDRITSLLLTLATFFVGFLLRPVGAVVFGHLGDKKLGRRNTLIVTLTSMGVISLIMGLMPTYQQIGILAPIGMIILRLLQGFVLGGEFGGGATLVAEIAPPEWRGFYIGILQMSNNSLLSVAVLSILSATLTPNQFIDFGWRLMFIIGIIIALVGLIIRLKLSESLAFKEVVEKAQIVKIPITEVLYKYWKKVLHAIGFSIGATVSIYTVSVFAVSYLVNFVKVPQLEASNVVLIGSIILLILTPVFGYLADKLGRRPLMITCWAGLLMWSYPFFLLISSENFLFMIIGFIVYYAFLSFNSSAGISVITEMFPTNVRYTAVSIIYNLNTGIFGGLTPFISTYLIALTHYILSPIYWLLTSLAISLVSAILIKETKGLRFVK